MYWGGDYMEVFFMQLKQLTDKILYVLNLNIFYGIRFIDILFITMLISLLVYIVSKLFD